MGSDRALVTGGSGYFGSRLVTRCLEVGRQCRVFDLNDADDRPADVEFVRGDIRDAGAIRRALDGIDVVFHNVAQVPLAKDRHLFESVNVLGTENLLRAAQSAGVRKVVYTSSSAVYGAPRSNPVTETTPRTPGEPYGRAKAAGEDLCEAYAKGGLDVSIVRPRTIVGHGRLGIFQILFEWVREGRNIPVLGDGSNRYQFIHAEDLANACMLAGARQGPASYNIGAERFGTMREVIEALCAHARTGSRVRGLPFWPAWAAMKVTGFIGVSPLGAYHALMYGRSMYFDVSRAREELGWVPRYSNDEMLIESYDWYLANRDRVLAQSGASHHRSAVRQGALALLKYLP
jgi:nucleoside-diphosphate-sugar epimerase